MTAEPVAGAESPTDLDALARQLEAEMREAVWAWDAGRARSQQTNIGASEVGHPCDRFLYFKALGVPEGPRGDSWLASVGTAVHEYLLADALKPPTWIVGGQRLDIAPGITGTDDVYYAPARVVIDHKILGTESHLAVRKGRKQQYRVQAHLYGYGWRNRGREVDYVAIAAWPRSNFLDRPETGLRVVIEPYDEQVVEAALQRWYRLAEWAAEETYEPARLAPLLPTADGPCGYCPYRDPERARTDPGAACAGDPSIYGAAEAAVLKGIG